MSETHFDIVFYGILQPGQDKDAAIDSMARLFKVTPEKVRPYFAGGRKVIKSQVDAATARKYQSALEQIGLVIKAETSEHAPWETGDYDEQPTGEGTDIDTSGLSVADVGADVLEHHEEVAPPPIEDIGDVTIAEPGADVFEHPPVVKPQPIGDISDITLAERGADVLEHPPEVEPEPIGDISGITLAEPGSDVLPEHESGEPPPIPDTSGITLAEETEEEK